MYFNRLLFCRLKIAKSAAGNAEQIERFAEHPYLEIIQDEMRIDIVPCYNVERGQWQSATDRTPFHTDYVKKNLKPDLLGEVRLLKKFMQGVGVYGAEVKIGGFSGYLCDANYAVSVVLGVWRLSRILPVAQLLT
jgi:tRNA nucleotidyltransferase (CCA-adding enzyme)